MSFRTRDSYLAVGIVPPVGDAVLVPLRVAELAHKATVMTSQNAENRGTSNAAADEAEEGYAQVTFRRRLRGSGSVGTPPPDDPLLRAAQMEATDVTGIAGTIATYANTGGVGSLTWDDSPATVMTAGAVLTISAGAGLGQRRTVKSWDAGTDTAVLSAPFAVAPDNTSRYDVLRQRVYAARPEAAERIAAAVRERNLKDAARSIRSDLSRGMATFQLRAAPGKSLEINWTLRGVLPGPPTEAAWADPQFAAQARVPPKLLSADLWFGGREASRMYELVLDHAATIDQAPDVSERFGMDEADATEHRTGGTFTYERVALSTDDPMTSFLAGTPKDLMLILGQPGNGFALSGEATIVQHDTNDQRSRRANAVSYRFAAEDRWYRVAAF